MKIKELFEEVLPGHSIDRDDNFILDSGSEVEMINNIDKSKIKIPRYAAWVYGCQGKNKSEVAECSNDLNYLMKKYKVPEKRVVKFPNR